MNQSVSYQPLNLTLVKFVPNFTPTHAITYTYMEVRVPNSSACHAYIMWAELGHCHLYVIAVSNVVTTGNGTGTKNVLK